MVSYTAPLRDMRFIYNELFDSSEITALPGCEDATPDLVDAVLEEAAKLCQNELFPLNRTGDEEGCQWNNGEVTTPAGFKEEIHRGRLERTGLFSRTRRSGYARCAQRSG